MKKSLINTQISNVLTIDSYRRRMCNMAENVLLIKELPEYVDSGYVNKILLKDGAIVFFVDELYGLLALPYFNITMRDMYGRPQQVRVHGENGLYQRTLSNINIYKDEDGNEIIEPKEEPEFVIMYDNQSRLSLYPDILQLSTRIGNIQRIQDINILQQKTPRIWNTSDEQVRSLKDALNMIDGNESVVMTLSPNMMKDTNCILEPAPYLADKLHDAKQELWNEFLTMIGVANTSFQKKERNITDEVQYSQGGTIANRYNRFEARKKAIDLINKYLVPRHNAIEGIAPIKDLQVEFYDGLPTTLEKDEGKYEDDIVYEDTTIEEKKEGDVNDI